MNLKMSLNPKKAFEDLLKYLSELEFNINKEAQDIFIEVELISQHLDTFPLHDIHLFALLNKHEGLKNIFIEKTRNPLKISRKLMREFGDKKMSFDNYEVVANPFTDDKHPRTEIIDLCMAVAMRNSRKVIEANDIVESLLFAHDEITPAVRNSDWTDSNLHLNYNILSHIWGRYLNDLDISFSEIRTKLNIPSKEEMFPSLIEQAPIEIRSSLIRFFNDFPNYMNNCFLIMSFENSKFHTEITQLLEKHLHKYQINLIRADYKNYSDELWRNIQTYLHGCRYAFAVFERISTEQFNPNVSLEVGYVLSMQKKICLLKERTLPKLPTDIVGRLYYEFDIQNMNQSIERAIDKWANDIELKVKNN